MRYLPQYLKLYTRSVTFRRVRCNASLESVQSVDIHAALFFAEAFCPNDVLRIFPEFERMVTEVSVRIDSSVDERIVVFVFSVIA